ncbi:MAG: Ankyrin repeat and protein mask, partial [Chthonomonadaceae bacterium]|nr:Ankyrin repeat and protein mask [Chthonomonadaceae bacterium]
SAGADANTRDVPNDPRPMLKQILDRLRGVPVPPGNSALLVHLGYVRDKNKPAAPWIALPENTAIARALLDHHADPNARADESKTTPLMHAAAEGKDATVRLLLERGAKVKLTDSQGTDALHFAAESGSVTCVRLLLDAGADVNSRDSLQNVPLMNAVSAEDVPIVKLLISRGADVNAKDSAEEPVLTYAVRVHSRPLIALLKAAGAR